MAKTIGRLFKPEKPADNKKEVMEKLKAEGIEFGSKLPLSELRKLLVQK